MSLVNDYLKRLGKKSRFSTGGEGGGVPPVLQKNHIDPVQTAKRRKYIWFAGIGIAVCTIAYCLLSAVTAVHIPGDNKSAALTKTPDWTKTNVSQNIENQVEAVEQRVPASSKQLVASEANREELPLTKRVEPQAVIQVASSAEESRAPERSEQHSSSKNSEQATTATAKQIKEEKKIIEPTSPDKMLVSEVAATEGTDVHEQPYPIIETGKEIGGTTNQETGTEISGKKVFFEKSTNTSAYYYQIALRAQHDNDFRRAERYYRNTLQEEPDHENALVNLAAIYIQEKRLQEAQFLLEKVIELNPENSKALVNAGMIALQKNEMETASDYFHQALKYNPIEETALINLAYLALQKKNYADATIYYDKLVWVSPGKIDILLAYAALEEKKQQYNSAIKLYKQCLEQLDTKKYPGQYEKIKGRIQILRQLASQQDYNNFFDVNDSARQ